MIDAYDYIIVGAGSAGCVLADRLSANGKNTVLLVEAGGKERNPMYRLPMLAGRLYRYRMNNWFYNSVAQPDLHGREIFLPRGKMVGGSFIFNGMQYNRGHAVDYDTWAQLGNRGWSYDDVLPYFKKSEQYHGGESGYHGCDGPLPVTKAAANNPVCSAFLQACEQAGHPLNSDFNGAKQEGFGFFDFNIRDGQRWTTAHAFLYPALRRANLRLLARTAALKVAVSDGAATGVEVSSGGEWRRIDARCEVILAAGAINTPKLLMLSGIGPASELQVLDIEVVLDSPGVGKNFQDHITVSIGYHSKQPVTLVRSLRLDRLVGEMVQAALFRTGPVARSVLEAGGFMNTRAGLSAPDIQVVFTSIFGPAARIWMPWAQSLDDHSFGAGVWPIRPESRGEITLQSKDPSAAPIIDPKFLSSRGDIDTTVAGLKELRRILRQPALAPFRGEEIKPGVDVVDDADWVDFIRASGVSGHHACGTAKMGNDERAVVDDRLRVRGLRKLRIADASIMPLMSSGNTNAPVIMIAEKAADMILADQDAGS